MQTRRKNFIICVFIGILVIVAAVFVIIFCQKTDDATAEELIEFNKTCCFYLDAKFIRLPLL